MNYEHIFIVRECTIRSYLKIHDRPNPYVDDSQESLILFLELLLIEDLYSQYTFLGCPPKIRLASDAPY